jgi:hypothetical protein
MPIIDPQLRDKEDLHGREVRWVCKHAVYARGEFCKGDVVAELSE